MLGYANDVQLFERASRLHCIFGLPGKGGRRMLFDWLKRKRLSDEGRRRLLVALAKAEEAILETHVRNALDVIATVGDELPLDRVLELYLEALEPMDGRQEIIARRVLARLEGEDEDSGGKGSILARRRRFS